MLGKIESLPKLLNVGREKGLRTTAAIQDWEQMRKLYGSQDCATIEARFKIKIVCALGISETRKRVVEHYAGKRTIKTWEDAGRDRPKQPKESEVPVIDGAFLSDELGVHDRYGRLLVRCVIFGLGNPAVVSIPFTEWPDRRPAHLPINYSKN